VRGAPRHFTSSKLFCWVAVDRWARLARLRGDEATAERWQAAAEEIHADICERGTDDRGVFVQHYDTDELDASLLLLLPVGFLPPDDERVRATVLAIADELTVDGLVLRYRVGTTDDGLSGEEGTFTICSFWLVSALAEIGEIDRARTLCEKLLSYASPLLLYAEEIEPNSGRHLGNFPQAFTHLALINAVMQIVSADQVLTETLARESAELGFNWIPEAKWRLGTVRTATAPKGALPSAYSPARPGSAWSRGPGAPLSGGVSGISSRQMRPKDSSRGSTASSISSALVSGQSRRRSTALATHSAGNETPILRTTSTTGNRGRRRNPRYRSGLVAAICFGRICANHSTVNPVHTMSNTFGRVDPLIVSEVKGMVSSDLWDRMVAVVTMSATKSCLAASQPASWDVVRSG